MSPTPTPQELAALADEEIEQLALAWRGEASRGDRNAFGLAHALEVEWRRRQRENLPSPPVPKPVAQSRPWWQLW